MSDDLISRQEVLNKLNKLDQQELYLPCYFKEYIIEEVPSVQPKTGRWEPLFGTIGKVFKCSECSATVTVAYECFKDGCYYDYCPYCGAKMKGETE